MLSIYVISALLCAAHAQTGSRFPAATGCEQKGLTEGEILEFELFALGNGINLDITPDAAGTEWEFKSDGYVPYAAHDFFGASNRNPFSIVSQNHSFAIPQVTQYKEEPQCLPLGTIGIALDGVPIYNMYALGWTDAVIYETFDDCNGHPDPDGKYHYHQSPVCITDGDINNELLGVALDGIPIYGMLDEDGNTLTSDDLDICHGGPLSRSDNRYVYRMTAEPPYTLGCFWGDVTDPNTRLAGQNCVFANVTESTASSPDLYGCITTTADVTTTASSRGNWGGNWSGTWSGTWSGNRAKKQGGAKQEKGGKAEERKSKSGKKEKLLSLLELLMKMKK